MTQLGPALATGDAVSIFPLLLCVNSPATLVVPLMVWMRRYGLLFAAHKKKKSETL
jgi:hypothetical protein